MLSKGEKIFLKRVYEELEKSGDLYGGYVEIYSDYEELLAIILSSYHENLNKMFNYMNVQLKKTGNKYFHADNSRQAINLFSKIKTLINSMKSLKISLESNYELIIQELDKHLSSSRGTVVPDDFKNIEIIEVEPIFRTENYVKIKDKRIKLTPIGEGSYAEVYKYYDENYDKYFVLKRLKKDVSEKDKERFNREFEITKEIKSPYIVEVYKLDKENLEYTMEYLDENLYEYINKNNSKLVLNDRRKLVIQILNIFSLLETLQIFHRDISYKNVLLKIYTNGPMIKICDFGLVKLNESILTTPDTEFRGSLNDPHLEIIGLKKYSIIHETYALTRLIVFILSGKTNLDKIKNVEIRNFLMKGTSKNDRERFQNITELRGACENLFRKLNEL